MQSFAGSSAGIVRYQLGIVSRLIKNKLQLKSIPADQPERGRIDQINVAADQLPEGGFRSGPGILCKQCLAVGQVLFATINPQKAITGQESSPGLCRGQRG